jgi:hypothetical protein
VCMGVCDVCNLVYVCDLCVMFLWVCVWCVCGCMVCTRCLCV